MKRISEAKSAGTEGAEILGHQKRGGIILLPDGRFGALKHNSHRYNHGSTKPWGRKDYAYIQADIMPVGYHLEVPCPEATVQTVTEWLSVQETGEQPLLATIGAEVEAVTYNLSDTSLAPSNGSLWPLDQNEHPELLNHMLETATGQTPEDQYPRTATETALAVSQAILQAEDLAGLQNKRLVYSSVPEGGSIEQAQITPHPYLLAFSPKVLRATLNHQLNIPSEVIALYNHIGIEILSYLDKTNLLNWPVNALHVHSGVPQIDGLADPRSGYAMAQVRMTDMAKVLSLMLYNTRHCYGVDTGLKDVRSVMRRLLATSHDSTLPPDADTFIKNAVHALESGQIHSLPRHPWQGQHDRIRIRMDGDKKTMESIDAAMNPDLRIVIAWIFSNQIMNTIALEALQAVNGDETQVLPYLEYIYGSLLRPIPALGEYSSYGHDLQFNRDGYDSIVPGQGKETYRQFLQKTKLIMQHAVQKYLALKTQAVIVSGIIDQQTTRRTKIITLDSYMGNQGGVYKPNGSNIGLITDCKNIPLDQLITIQAESTQLQAMALSQIRDEKDLLAWFGLS